MNQCSRDGFSTCSVYHLVGPVSVVAAFAPTNGFVAAARLKHRISNDEWLVRRVDIYLLLFFSFSFAIASNERSRRFDETRLRTALSLYP